VFVVHNKVSQN